MLYPIFEQYALTKSQCDVGLQIEETVGYESTVTIDNKLHTEISSTVKAEVSG